MQIKLQAGKLIRNREEHAIEFINIGRSVNDGGIPAVIFGVQLPNGDRVDLNLHADDASVLGQELLGFAELSIKDEAKPLILKENAATLLGLRGAAGAGQTAGSRP